MTYYDTEATRADTQVMHDLEVQSKSNPQPAVRILDTARACGFTGEVTFKHSPPVRVYFDGGLAYFGERDGEAPLGRRLVEAGVVTTADLERGAVRVGGVEHLGRLFERAIEVDRDQVMVAVELSTDELMTYLASHVIAPISVVPYRHHSSGVHRWFVHSAAQRGAGRPLMDVAPVGDAVGGELPALPSSHSSESGDEIRIEWDDDTELEAASRVIELDDTSLDDTSLDNTSLDNTSLERLLDHEGTSAEGDVAPSPVDATSVLDVGPDVDAAAVVDVAAPDDAMTGDDDEFVVRWPDAAESDGLAAPVASELVAPEAPGFAPPELPGAEVPGIDAPDGSDLTVVSPVEDTLRHPPTRPAVPASPTDALAPTLPGHDVARALADVDAAPDDETAIAPSDQFGATLSPEVTAEPFLDQSIPVEEAPVPAAEPVTPVAFEMPKLSIPDSSTATADVPEDVADAVRRAISAIEAASRQAAAAEPMSEWTPTASPLTPTSPAGSTATESSALAIGVPAAEAAAPDAPEPAVVVRAAAASALPVDDVAPVAEPRTVMPDGDASAQVAAAPFAGAFAPPTMEMRAEVIYARLVEEHAKATGRPSVVFVDDTTPETPQGRRERAGALRRLISSIRSGR